MTELIPFVTLMIISIFGFSTTYYTIRDNDDKKTILTSISHMYLLIFGEFSIDNYGQAEFTLFFAATFFLALIMLNLVIALMTDTYERVMTNIVE